ncbi:hypothetical protein ASH01_17000 [Terrabacter sp. Soil811]|nr:hypothetical protein ASH01_17000 [Terrabacter sp. Soil811]
MSEHELLLRHASHWALQRQRVCDTELLETALELRSVHDALPPNLWPAGSVEDLMLHRWPSHGQGMPDVDVLAESIDTFVRFLRVTGRMASGSGDPRALAREAHRAAPRMAAACADPANFGPTKSLMAFGRAAGFPVDHADTVEELDETMQQVVAAWNALPEHDRKARMPLAGDRGAVHGTGAGFDVDQSLDGDFEPAGVLERGDPARAAAQARRAPFVQACLQLADWVGVRRKVTATGVLRLAEARDAYAELELWRWQEEVDGITHRRPDAAASRDFRWKRAGDALPLERLWFAAQSAGLVETLSTVARNTDERPVSDDEWVGVSVALTLALWLIVESAYDRSPVPVLTVLGGCALMGSITSAQVREQWQTHPGNSWGPDYRPSGFEAESQRYSDEELTLSLHFFTDTGIWEVDGDTYRLTDLGREFATLLFTYLEEGID